MLCILFSMTAKRKRIQKNDMSMVHTSCAEAEGIAVWRLLWPELAQVNLRLWSDHNIRRTVREKERSSHLIRYRTTLRILIQGALQNHPVLCNLDYATLLKPLIISHNFLSLSSHCFNVDRNPGEVFPVTEDSHTF